MLLFVDATTVHTSHSEINTLFTITNNQLDNLFTRVCANKLTLKESKTKYIVIRHCHISPDLTELTITLNDTQLDRLGNDCDEQFFRFLGIYIDVHLT